MLGKPESSCNWRQTAFLDGSMWTRFMPAIRRLLDDVAAGVIGTIRLVQADLAFRATGPKMAACSILIWRAVPYSIWAFIPSRSLGSSKALTVTSSWTKPKPALMKPAAI